MNKEITFFKEFSNKSKDLIRKLLRKDYTKRIGMKEIKSHPFFKEIDWGRLYDKKISPPYKPSMREINFSSEFTSIPVTFNFEEEITRNTRKMSEIRPSIKREASTFGKAAQNAIENLKNQQESEIKDCKRKNSVPKGRPSMTMKFFESNI